MNLTVKEAFDWAHQGVRIENFPVGALIETDDQDLIDVATREGWAEIDGAKAAEPNPEPAPAPAPELEKEPDPTPAPEPAPAQAAGRKKK